MFELYIFEYEWRSFLLQISVDTEIQVLLGDVEESLATKIASYPPQLYPQPVPVSMPSKKIICSGKSNHERSWYDLDQVMLMCQTAVAKSAKDLNIFLSGLDIVEDLEQKSISGTLLPFLASDPPSYRRFFWSFSPPQI